MQPHRILLLAVVATVGCSATTRPPEDEVDRLIIEAMGEQKLPAVSILVLKDGRVLKNRAYGKARLDPPVSADTSTHFPIFSITKTFTAVGVLRLVDQGKLALDDPIVKHLPDIHPAWRAITVRQLLSHTSGLPDLHDPSTEWKQLSEDREDALKEVAKRPMVARPGEECAYIQTGYVLLGKIVEQMTGKPFARYMTEDVFGPLGMSSAVYGNRRSIVLNRTTQYEREKYEKVNGAWRAEELGAARPAEGIDNPSYQDVGATLNVSTDDLVKWEAALVSGKLLTPESLSAMWTVAPASVRISGYWTRGTGLGWRVAESSAHRTAYFDAGGAALYLRCLDDGLTIVVLTNCHGAKTDAIAGRIISHYFPDLVRHSPFTVQ